MLRLAILSGLLAWGAAFAQSSLLIDGRPAGEVRTDLVPGNSYAPADRLAEELGARLAAPVGSDTVALLFSGHVLQLGVVPFGDEAGVTGAVRLDGSPVGDLAAIRGDDAVWVPVAPVVRAFGASISYLAERDAVVIVTPRPSVNDATLERRDGFDLLRISLDGPVAWQRFDDAAVGVTEITLRRARLTQAESLAGTWIRRADLIPAGQGVRVRIDAPGATLEVTTLAAGRGSEVRIRVQPASDTPDEPRGETDLSVVLDPGHGAGSGLPGEGEATLSLARAVAERLEREGVSVRLTRQAAGDVPHAQRLSAAADADLFLSLHAADLPSGEVRVWVLGEAAEEAVMRAAIRRNAREALNAGVEDELRRRILLGLVPDLELGRRYGRAIATALFQVGGYRAGEVEAAPLALLEGAAGRGVLLEFALDDLRDPDLPEVLAAAVRSAASGAQ
ncbi:MAG: N-acetylmuramoyl-L-alanine amidase [Trueperaceae bacterium]|nr:N-acetylmuramoyl-L-alanine amidase [Trueperaceae bacterium]